MMSLLKSQLSSSMEQLAKIPETEKLEQCYQTVLTSYASFISILQKDQDKEQDKEQDKGQYKELKKGLIKKNSISLFGR
jgi:hypothetical protein